MVKDCPKCGGANRDIASFCSKCGTSFSPPGAQVTPPPVVPVTPPPVVPVTPPPPPPPNTSPQTAPGFPSVPGSPQVRPTAPSFPKSPGAGMCSYHPNLPAIYICSKCGKPICQNCTRTYMNLVLCPQCQWQLFPQTPQPVTFPSPPQPTTFPSHTHYQY